MTSAIDAVLLAGGRGTRLAPLTLTVPKPLLPLGERPIIDVLIAQLAAAGVRRVFVCLGYLAPLMMAFLGDGSRWGVTIEPRIEREPLGTAGGLRAVDGLTDDFFVVNGDTLTDLDFAGMAAAHRDAGAWATLFTPFVDEKVDYGVVSIDAYGGLTDYQEKPRRGYHVSSGVYVLSRPILELIPPAGAFDMPDLIRAAMGAGRKVIAHAPAAYWKDIGRIDHYEAATRDFEADPARFLPG
ncbi:MAG TPA: sugar phosphate nucleotidyltransferase [Caulobacteraceae bacterium]|jgi:NDP-sugar pyrophosphorylase family protein|nr:sugar phosphate nucleotidyltransferase [Caulobacteraceae bacterium]